MPLLKLAMVFSVAVSYAYPNCRLLLALKIKKPPNPSSIRYATPSSIFSPSIKAAVKSIERGEAFTYRANMEGLKVMLLFKGMS